MRKEFSLKQTNQENFLDYEDDSLFKLFLLHFPFSVGSDEKEVLSSYE